MPRRCLADRLLVMTETDPGLILAGPAAQMVFIRLMRLAARMGSDGFLAFGSALRNLAEVSIAVAIRQTELETHVETLVDRGVLVREGEALVCPSLREAGRKAAAARANGGLGGRPRKGETVEAMRARRQGHLMLPVSGGKPTGTEAETLSRARPALASSSAEELSKPSKPRVETDAIALGHRVLAAAGVDPATWMGSFGEVRSWLAEGLDAETIVATVERVAARPRYAPPRSLRYFSEAMREAASRPAREPRPAAGVSLASLEGYAAWREACARYRDEPYGPPPLAPPAIAAALEAMRGAA